LNFAFLGRERLSDLPLNEYVAQNDRITDLVTDAVERTGASGMFLPSSGAVYRRPGRRLQEDLSADPYGALKLRDERRFQGLGLRLGFPVSIFRVFNLAGPFINKLNSYALATILSDLNRGGPVVLRAAHPVIRAYTHVGDVLTLALADLATGRSGPPIDTLGAPAIEIGDLARLASTALGLPEPEIIRPPFDGTPPDNYVGDGEAFAALAERHGIMLTDLPNQIRATAAYLRDLA
jgi:nucleoside-diphosphate-sugar epimerase